MEKKRIGFVAFLVIGNIAFGISAFYYIGKDVTVEIIAIFTALSTAAYTILNEPEKPQPLLRVTPHTRGGNSMGTLGFDLFIDNIGDALAKDIEITCKTNPQHLTLEKNGSYSMKNIPPRDPEEVIMVVHSMDTKILSSQRIEVEVKYSNKNGKRREAIKENYEIRELLDELDKETLL